MWDNYGDTWDTDFISEDYVDLNSVIRETENSEGGSNCLPKIIDTIVEQGRDGEYTEKQVYNCSNCTNLDCPYFYEDYGE